MTGILVLSENVELTSDIRKYLIDEDYSIIEAQELVSEEEISPQTNLIILDSTGLERDVTSSINQLKRPRSTLLVIVIVKQGDVKTAVQAIRAGAVNALALPIDKQTLCKSIEDGLVHQSAYHREQGVVQQAIDLLKSLRNTDIPIDTPLRKKEPEQASISTRQEKVIYGDLILYIREEKAFYRKESIDLTASQFRLLSCLAESHKHIVSYEDLYFCLHNIHLDRASARKALSAHLSYLRAKLGEVGCEEYLVNVRGRGYLLDIPAEEADDTDEIGLGLILEQLPIVIWTTNPQLRLTSVLGAEHFYPDKPPNTFIGSSLEDFLQISPSSLIVSAHQQALVGDVSHHNHVSCDRLFRISIQPYTGHNDKIIGCIGVAFEVADPA